MRVFVTGASGFIGTHLVSLLLEREHSVTALVRSPGRVPQACEAVVGDITDRRAYRHALRHCDAVLHLAAEYRLGPGDRKAMFAANVEGTRELLDAAIAAGVERVVHVSSTAALGETFGREGDEHHRHNGVFRSYYEETKHIAHGLARSRAIRGAPIVLAIPGGVFGAGDSSMLGRTLSDFARDKLPFQIATTSRFNLCHVRSVCHGLVRILQHSPIGESWILAGINISMPELFSRAAAVLGRKPPRAIPGSLLKLPARAFDAAAHLAGGALPLSREALAVLDGSTYTYSSAKARRQLGWEPGDVERAFADYVLGLR